MSWWRFGDKQRGLPPTLKDISEMSYEEFQALPADYFPEIVYRLIKEVMQIERKIYA